MPLYSYGFNYKFSYSAPTTAHMLSVPSYYKDTSQGLQKSTFGHFQKVLFFKTKTCKYPGKEEVKACNL